jgi:hypothetical protein
MERIWSAELDFAVGADWESANVDATMRNNIRENMTEDYVRCWVLANTKRDRASVLPGIRLSQLPSLSQ